MAILTDDDRMAALNQFTQNNRAFMECYESLLKRHPNEWVAFHDGEVRATGKSLEEVLQQAEQVGAPRKIMCLHYLDPNPTVMIL